MTGRKHTQTNFPDIVYPIRTRAVLSSCKSLKGGNVLLESGFRSQVFSRTLVASRKVFKHALVYAYNVDQPAGLLSSSTGVANSYEEFSRYPDLSQQYQRGFTWEEVGHYDGVDGAALCIVMDDKVYNVTDFVDSHAGGPSYLRKYGGRDAGDAMRASPMPPYAFQVMKRFQVGYIVSGDNASGSKC